MIFINFFLLFLIIPAHAGGEKYVDVLVDGQSINSDVKPYIDAQNRTIVPMRWIGEKLGFVFAWDAENRVVAFSGNRVMVTIPIGQKEATVNDKKVLMDTTAVIKDGRTMVPLRFVLENLGLKVEYRDSTKEVNILFRNIGEGSGETDSALGKTVTISEDIVNVRSGPGTSYSIVTKVKKGDSFQVLDQGGDWYRIALNNKETGWVAGWLVVLRGETDLPSRSEEPGEGRDSPEPILPEPVEILDVDADVVDGEVILSVTGNQELHYATFGLDNPRRLVMDLPGAILKTGNIGMNDIAATSDLVNSVRFAQFTENQVRIVIDVSGPAGLSLVSSKKDGCKLEFKVGKPSLREKVIVIDPGHGSIQPGGWSDPGAVGPSKLYERDVVLDIAVKTAKILRGDGATVILTRTGDTSLSLVGRADVANQNNADVFVSIHANSNTSSTPSGTSTYYYGSVNGQELARKKLAAAVQQELVNSLGRRNIGIIQGNYAVLRNTLMPSILVETAFISNYEEEQLLSDESFRLKAAQGIARGIENYLLNP